MDILSGMIGKAIAVRKSALATALRDADMGFVAFAPFTNGVRQCIGGGITMTSTNKGHVMNLKTRPVMEAV